MVRTLADLNNQGGPNNPAANPLNMGRMGRDFDWTTIPSCFYVIGLIITVMFLLTSITGLGILFVNIPIYTILSLQIWRVFFSYFITTNIISLLITYLVIFSLSMTEEVENGSGRFFLQIFKRNLAIQILECFFGLILYFTLSIRVFSYGIWPVYFTYLTERCMENPEGVTYFCMMPCPIKNKIYPVVLLMIFTLFGLMSGEFPIDIWLGFALAHLWKRKPAIKALIEPSLAWSEKFQGYLRVFNGKLGRIAPLAERPEPREGPLDARPQDNAPGAKTSDIVKKAFTGGGVRIGGTNAGTNMFTNYDHLDKQDNPEPSATQQTTPFDDARTTASHHQGLPPQNYQPQPTTNQRGNKHDDSL